MKSQSNGTKKSPEEIAKAMTDFIKEENMDILEQKPLTPEQLTKLKQIFGDLYERAYEKDPEMVNPPQTDDLALLEDTMKEL